MKKVLVCSILVLAFILAGCGPKIETSQVKSFSFSSGGGLSFISESYEIDKTDLVLRHTLSGERAYTRDEKPDVKWDEAKWNAFIGELLQCRITNWESHYEQKGFYDGDTWGVKLEGDFETITRSGYEAYPPNWDQFSDVLKRYIFDSYL